MFANAPQQVTAAVSAKASVTKAYRQKVLGEEEEEEVAEEEEEVAEEEEEKDTDEELPPLEGECAVCFDAMLNRVEVTACPTCRNHLHTDCLQHWLQHSLTCVYCRAPLSRSITSPAGTGAGAGAGAGVGREEGYVNLGDMQGVSRVRDDSSYSNNYHRFSGSSSYSRSSYWR
mgnify:CR=1 FL=1